MDVKDIESNLIKMYIGESDYDAILIDGPWGCGKTYAINEFINLVRKKGKINKTSKEINESFDGNRQINHELCSKIKKSKIKKIVYVSLYGANSVEDIKAKLDKATKHHMKFKRTVCIIHNVLSALSPYKVFDNAVASIQNTLKNTEVDKPIVKKGSMVIFDDLERVNYKEFSFVNFMGYINSLVSRGIKVVCVCANDIVENHLSMNDEKQDLIDYKEFREKTFGKPFIVERLDSGVIIDIANGYTISQDFADTLLDVSSKNLRTFTNALILANQIKRELENKNQWEQFCGRTTDEKFIYSALQTILCFYDTYEHIDPYEYFENAAAAGLAVAEATASNYINNFDSKTKQKIEDFVTTSKCKEEIIDDMQKDLFMAIAYFYINNNDLSLINDYINR